MKKTIVILIFLTALTACTKFEGKDVHIDIQDSQTRSKEKCDSVVITLITRYRLENGKLIPTQAFTLEKRWKIKNCKDGNPDDKY